MPALREARGVSPFLSRLLQSPSDLWGGGEGADTASWVVGVEVDQADALPGAEQQPAALDGHGEGRSGEDRQEVVGAVAAAAVAVQPAVVPGKEPLEHRLEVLLGAGAGLHHG